MKWAEGLREQKDHTDASFTQVWLLIDYVHVLSWFEIICILKILLCQVLIILERNDGWNNTVTMYSDGKLHKQKFQARIGRKFTVSLCDIIGIWW